MNGPEQFAIDPLTNLSQAILDKFDALTAARRDLAAAEAADDAGTELAGSNTANARRLGETCDQALYRTSDAWGELLTCEPRSLVEVVFLLGLWLEDDRWGMSFRGECEQLLSAEDLVLLSGIHRELERLLAGAAATVEGHQAARRARP